MGCYRISTKNGIDSEGVNEVDPLADIKVMQLAELRIGPCAVCADCGKKPFECLIEDDFASIFDEMKLAGGIIISSPYYVMVPSKLQAFIERLAFLNRNTQIHNPETFFHPLANKPCGLLAVAMTGEYFSAPLLDYLARVVYRHRMKLIITEVYPWTGVCGKEPITEDLDAIKNARVLGRMVARAAKEKREV
jgi:multimeric flavodoxin WrbA